MTTYDILNAFAQSWMVVVMTVFFVGVMAWVIRPGSRKEYSEAANMIFDHETHPGSSPGKSKEA